MPCGRRGAAPLPSEALTESFRLRVLTGQSLTSLSAIAGGGFRLKLDQHELKADRVLFATGRRPATDQLGLAALGLENLEVGADLRVAGHDHVFAVGDVNGKRMVVHQAHIEAGIAAENAVRETDRRWQRRANLQVIYTDPEFAFAGLSREDAKAAGHDVVTATEESREVGKLHLAGDDHGLGELIADRESHQLLGAGLLCEAASDLIHLPAYAIEHQHTVHQLAGAEYYHPTRTEILSNIADRLCEALGGNPFCRADE